MVQAVNCDLLLYADDTGLIFQHKDINIIEQQLNRNFSNICDWFVDNKLSIHFGEDKTKSILFAPLNKCKKLRKLNISYGSLKIKQYSEVTYLGCILDESLSGESMALNVVSKINTCLKFWYPNLNKKLKTKLRTLENKCINKLPILFNIFLNDLLTTLENSEIYNLQTIILFLQFQKKNKHY